MLEPTTVPSCISLDEDKQGMLELLRHIVSIQVTVNCLVLPSPIQSVPQ